MNLLSMILSFSLIMLFPTPNMSPSQNLYFSVSSCSRMTVPRMESSHCLGVAGGRVFEKGGLGTSFLDKIFHYPIIKTFDDIKKFFDIHWIGSGGRVSSGEEETSRKHHISYWVRSKLSHFFLVELSRKTDRPFLFFAVIFNIWERVNVSPTE